VVEALRLYARTQDGEPSKYKVERWDWKDAHVEETVASPIMVGHSAFHPAVVSDKLAYRASVSSGST
jgi:hypothetical protein